MDLQGPGLTGSHGPGINRIAWAWINRIAWAWINRIAWAGNLGIYLLYSLTPSFTGMKLGIIRETKSPPDRRVPLTPLQCREISDRFSDLEITVQPSDNRCFSDQEYRGAGIMLQEDMSDCQVLLGVKEVDINCLLEGKTYLFFSHTAKKQPYNRKLLREVVRKGIRLIDYEYLTGEDEQRVVAFGRWAGVVGGYNGLRGYGLRTGSFELRPAFSCHDLEQLQSELGMVEMNQTRIVLTGGGRVAGGATEILDHAGIAQVDPRDYLDQTHDRAVYTRLDPWHYARRRDGSPFDFGHYITRPDMYENSFLPYAQKSDLYIACHYWDPRAPILLSRKDLNSSAVHISVIADISCDINGPIASTIRASTIAEPFYGYDPEEGNETRPFLDGSITVMAVDNLPGELPRDASEDFGTALMDHVIPELIGERDTGMLQRACIAQDGRLTKAYMYLNDYLEGRE